MSDNVENKEPVQQVVQEQKVEVDPRLVEIESGRQKLEKERKEFETARKQWEAERTSVKQPENTFDFDEVVVDPYGYYKAQGLDDDAVFELASAIFFSKNPQKASSEWQQKRQERMMRASEKKTRKMIEEQNKKLTEEADNSKAQEVVKRIFDAFSTVAKSVNDESHPHLAAWFGEEKDGKTVINEMELTKALIELAKDKEEVVELTKLVDEMEGWFAPRFARYKPKTKKEESKEETAAPQILSTQDTQVKDRTPAKNEQERIERAIEAMKQGSFIKRD